MYGQANTSAPSLARRRHVATVTLHSQSGFSAQNYNEGVPMCKTIHCGRVTILALASLTVLISVHGQGIPERNAESGEVQALKQELAEQRKLLEDLRLLVLDQKTLVLEQQRQIDAVKLQQVAAAAPPGQPAVGLVASATPLGAPEPAPKPLPMVPPPAPQAAAAVPPSPLQIKIGEATIIPVGFMDLTNTWRSTNAGTSLQTNFGSIPYNNVVAGRVTEDKLSAANSRIGFRVDAKVKGWNVLGYFEGDFVGGVGDQAENTQVSSNSLLFRIRTYWVDLRRKEFEFLAGQSWSMLTPNRKQISTLPADLFYSLVVDVNYMNGLTWARVPGVRFLYHPSQKVTFGISLENAAQYFGGSGGGGIPTLPSALAGNTQFTGQLDQNVINGIKVPTLHPDVISKLAFDPNSKVHFEIAGVLSTVKLFNPITQQYFSQTGGGGSINANVEIFSGLRLVTNNFWSDGEGRYLFGVVPDFIVRANGSPSAIHAGSTVSGFEYTRKSLQLYTYYGGISAGRNTALDANGTTPIGYGYTGSPNTQNKTTQEGTFGWTHTWWRDGKYGAFQTMFQYAYFFRNPWFVPTSGAPKNTHEHAVWFNIRYVLPGSAPTISY
jgi:hypothetical protein